MRPKRYRDGIVSVMAGNFEPGADRRVVFAGEVGHLTARCGTGRGWEVQSPARAVIG